MGIIPLGDVLHCSTMFYFRSISHPNPPLGLQLTVSLCQLDSEVLRQAWRRGDNASHLALRCLTWLVISNIFTVGKIKNVSNHQILTVGN